MKLRELIVVPLKNIAFVSDGQRVGNGCSDIHFSCFTDVGIERFSELLSSEVQIADTERGLIAISCEYSEILCFWELFTKFGSYKWNKNYDKKADWSPDYLLHKFLFTFTDEVCEGAPI